MMIAESGDYGLDKKTVRICYPMLPPNRHARNPARTRKGAWKGNTSRAQKLRQQLSVGSKEFGCTTNPSSSPNTTAVSRED